MANAQEVDQPAALERLQEPLPPPEWLDDADETAQLMVYLVTASARLHDVNDTGSPPLKNPAELSRKEFQDALFDAVANPIVFSPRGGRPRSQPTTIVKYIGVEEQHTLRDDFHHHAAVKLSHKSRFMPFKLALRQRHGLATHWSTSHQQYWSAARYLTATTEHKPVVDVDRVVWTPEGSPEMNIFEESQEPWQANTWRKRREAALSAPVDPEQPSGKKRRFNKMDFTALVIDQGLWTRDSVMSYVESKGSAEMQTWVNARQRKLKEFIQDAEEWRAAPAAAQAEKETDWQLVERLSLGTCQCGAQGCLWWSLAEQFFHRNAGVDRERLAANLRKVIQFGPGKMAKVPLIVGATNTGKSTVLDPVRAVFGPGAILNKPKIGASCPLSRLAQGKIRFMYFDDYRPVDYAALPKVPAPTISATLFLAMFCGQPFDVVVSQSFHDGHPEVEWHRGAAMTAKEEGLWEPKADVTREEIRHMQSRVEQFVASFQIPEADFETAPLCKESWCRWILTDSISFANRQGPERPLSSARPPLAPLARPELPIAELAHASGSADGDIWL